VPNKATINLPPDSSTSAPNQGAKKRHPRSPEASTSEPPPRGGRPQGSISGQRSPQKGLQGAGVAYLALAQPRMEARRSVRFQNQGRGAPRWRGSRYLADFQNRQLHLHGIQSSALNSRSTVYTPFSGVPRFPIPRSANSDSLQHHNLHGKQQLRRRCRAPLKAILRLMALRYKACILYSTVDGERQRGGGAKPSGRLAVRCDSKTRGDERTASGAVAVWRTS